MQSSMAEDPEFGDPKADKLDACTTGSDNYHILRRDCLLRRRVIRHCLFSLEVENVFEKL